jgi:hypothetical protein
MRRFRKAVIAGLLASLLIAAALASGCGSSSETVTVTVEATDAAQTTPAESGPTEAVLKPVGDQSATGTARYLLNPSRIPALQVEIHGLMPTAGNQRYGAWMYGDRHDMVMLGAFQVKEDGKLSRRFETVESYSFVEEGSKTELLISMIGNIDRVSEGIAEGGEPWDPPIIGEPVLQGTFEGPFVGSASNQ